MRGTDFLFKAPGFGVIKVISPTNAPSRNKTRTKMMGRIIRGTVTVKYDIIAEKSYFSPLIGLFFIIRILYVLSLIKLCRVQTMALVRIVAYTKQ